MLTISQVYPSTDSANVLHSAFINTSIELASKASGRRHHHPTHHRAALLRPLHLVFVAIVIVIALQLCSSLTLPPDLPCFDTVF